MGPLARKTVLWRMFEGTIAFRELQLAQEKAAKQVVDEAAAIREKCGKFRHRLCLCRNTGSLCAGPRRFESCRPGLEEVVRRGGSFPLAKIRSGFSLAPAAPPGCDAPQLFAKRKRRELQLPVWIIC